MSKIKHNILIFYNFLWFRLCREMIKNQWVKYEVNRFLIRKNVKSPSFSLGIWFLTMIISITNESYSLGFWRTGNVCRYVIFSKTSTKIIDRGLGHQLQALVFNYGANFWREVPTLENLQGGSFIPESHDIVDISRNWGRNSSSFNHGPRPARPK